MINFYFFIKILTASDGPGYNRSIMSTPLRIGIIGCGGMAQSHVRRFDKVKHRCRIAAAVDIVRERAQAVADLLDHPAKVATDYREILDEVDAVLVVLPHDLHHPVTVDCLNHGKHVLVEKPMANTEAECLEMLEASRRNNRVLMVAYCMRFDPLVLEMKRHIDEKTFGDLFELSIWTEQYTRYPEGHWALSAKRLGGGQFFSHGCHYIDLMLWMLGRPVRGCHLGTNRGTPWMEREGTSHVTIEFENGIVGYHGATWGARGTRLGRSFHAHFTGGMLEANYAEGALIFHSRLSKEVPDQIGTQHSEVIFTAPPGKATDEEMVHFIDCIENGTRPLTDAISSIEGLRVIWALYEAERENRMADLRGMGLGTFCGEERR